MQLPTSFTSTPLTAPVASRPSPAADNRPAREPERATPNRATEAQESQSAPQSRDQATVQAPERVTSPNEVEVPPQDPALRETISTTDESQNLAVNQYRQIAQQGVDNAQTQDPSLFRVDVYV
ncbi:hypothetical protein [Reinekea blandensis]|uniref:Uncharacterized protein n=1 Tax=Reinekea blandensis MED297 TaxID=314283 RepID=A4BC07_9GAMM|nr:hypothetical protein [Reinekea blandensis]EAR10492.1 hypothetical protein MED297_01685 [Reinekea sp. MED297] [Reinekea blandensis MED297]